jgi:alkanesulfonate monooxygenase
MSLEADYLWYIPNVVEPGHRGDSAVAGHNSLETLTSQARALEEHGWKGALIGTGWGRPDTFTVAAALAARTTSFEPLIAIRPGYWRPANFASAAATLDHLTGGRVRINIVSGKDNLAAYGDSEGDQAHRYGRTREFMRLVRRLWTEENVDFAGEHFRVDGSTVVPRIEQRGTRRHPRLYFGGASEAAERVAATEADVQLFWGEPLEDIRQRIERLQRLSRDLDRDLPPLEFGLRVTTFVRGTTEQAWAEAEARVAEDGAGARAAAGTTTGAVSLSVSSACSTCRAAARCSTTISTPRRASSAAAGPAPPGWSARPRTWRVRCASTVTSASAISSCRTRPICPRSGDRATNCCLCYGTETVSACLPSRAGWSCAQITFARSVAVTISVTTTTAKITTSTSPTWSQ